MKTHCKYNHKLTSETIYIRPDGYMECKICRRTRRLKYQEENKEKIRDRKRDNAYKYYQKNPEKFRRIARNFRKLYPEKVRQNNQNRRASIRGQLGYYKPWMEKYYRFIQANRCIYCNKEISNDSGVYEDGRETLEHIVPLTRGGLHCWSNTALSCRKCNLRKGNKTAEEFRSTHGR